MQQDKKILYILTGAPASGKSWVGKGASDVFDVVDSDITSKKNLVNSVACAARPLLLLTVGVSTFIKNNPQWECRLIVIKEDVKVIEERMTSRGGKITPTIEKRMKRMLSLAKKAVFVGTSSEVLEWVRSI